MTLKPIKEQQGRGASRTGLKTTALDRSERPEASIIACASNPREDDLKTASTSKASITKHLGDVDAQQIIDQQHLMTGH
ncbi:hypothetical protein Q8A67_012080 [Cirrhinus molitorella]|uniref:Uncharacterized protein n=1 Tax=Cirrhinus molitorella TaxID=172907 RepID=A0AA88PT85_9TELE|nr:hypothetical protein Q8A67_012080 [Cirrhinus molitorella]